MQEIPSWILKLIELEGLKCRECKSTFTSDHLMSISIQESSQPPHKDFLCIGLYCPDCKELMIFEIKEMSLVTFAFDIIDQETENKIEKKSNKKASASSSIGEKRKKRKKRKSKITKKEIDDIRKFLEPEDLDHEQMLLAMGMSPNEIDKYNYKKQEKKDDK